MGVDRDIVAQLRHLLRPLATRIANTVARSVVQLADDSKKLQMLQVGVLEGEDVDDAEHHQAYGFSSVPVSGAEAVVVFPNGDRGMPLVVAVSDRRYRPRGGQPGEVTVYNNTGAKITMTKDGDIVAEPAAGREMLVRSPSGTAVELATKADVQTVRNELHEHTHGPGTFAAPSGGGPVTGLSGSGPSVTSPAGTSVLKGE